MLRNFSLFLPLPATLGIPLPAPSSPASRTPPAPFSPGLPPPCPAPLKQPVSEFPLVARDLKIYLEGKCDIFLAGGVANFVGNWQKLTSDREILTTSKG